MPEPSPSPEDVIAATIKRVGIADAVTLATIIVLDLWEAGYEVRPKPDLIPIRAIPASR